MNVVNCNNIIFYYSNYFFLDIKMGNNNSDLTDAQFRQQWQTLTQFNGRNVWQNKQNPTLKLE